jgi:hypothetical protein
LHRIIKPEVAVASDGVEVIDLGVNPLSVVLVAIRPLNNTTTLSNFARYGTLVQSINRATIMHRGAAIFSMSGWDCAALNYLRHGIVPHEANSQDTDNERRCAVLPLIVGRFPWDPRSCIPETIRGELQLELDIDVSDTGYDDFRYSVESIELLGANPSEFERKTTISQTLAATGTQDIRLPIGHRYRGLLLFGTSFFGGGAPTPSLGRNKLLADGTEIAYTSTDWEVQFAVSALMGRHTSMLYHTHRVDATSASTTEATGHPIGYGGSDWRRHQFLDLDPTRDDTFSIDTRSLADWILQTEAEAADAVRVVTIEKIALTGG